MRTPSPPQDSQKPVDSTPFSKTGSDIHPSHKLIDDNLMNDLKWELHNAQFISEDFLDHLTGEADAAKIAQQMQILQDSGLLRRKSSSSVVEYGADFWSWPTLINKPDDERPIVDFLASIAFKLCDGRLKQAFAWPVSPKAPYPLSKGKKAHEDLRPDIVMLPVSAWDGLLVLGEHKITNANDAEQQVLKYLWGIKRHQPWRQSAVVFFMGGFEFGVIRGDQSGTEEARFDIRSEDGAIKFIRALYWLSMASNLELGDDPDYTTRTAVRKQKIKGNLEAFVGREVATIKCETTTYQVEDILYNGVSIRGRGTRVYAVKDFSGNGVPLVLKEMWFDTGRKLDETFFHDQAKARGVEGVVLAVGISRWDTHRTTLTTVRGYTPEQALALNIEYKLKNRRQMRLTLEEIAHGLLGAIKAHQSLFLKGNILHRDISERNVLLGEPRSGQGFLIDLDMAVLDARSSEGTTSYRTDSVVDGSSPFKRNRSYLEKENEPPSNDFDTESGKAISEDQGDLETEAHKAQRTGTIPYMASGVLLGEAHSVQHDLESFFYVLYLLPFSYDSPSQGRKVAENTKRANVENEEWMFQQLKDNTSEEWRRDHKFFYRLLGLIARLYLPVLRALLASRQGKLEAFDTFLSGKAASKERQIGFLTHEDLIKPLEAWLEAPPDQQEMPPARRRAYSLELETAGSGKRPFIDMLRAAKDD
ncbi:hypothetical protein BZG36_00109 [Bifiguratus adelaidae]|uniref:Protein kinase domain-containing protein n=1 Tax=Bifiguratus adelaidae TaxID=1938954 RepID=A0A261Y894_9FUNG|nr:hypothetical protein BZG36_00109 [Bifiguratus adelaidae]